MIRGGAGASRRGGAEGGGRLLLSCGHAVMRSFCVPEPPHRKQRAPFRAR